MRSEADLESELQQLAADAGLTSQERELIRSLVLLWHDHLDASHSISQGIENSDGSLLHAIMHRREPDYWNSKYWWRRVGDHPCFAEIAERSSALLQARGELALAKQLLPGGEWDPFALVDACEAAADDGGEGQRSDVLRELQRIESEVALDYFLARA